VSWLAWRVILRAFLRERGRALLSCGAVALGVSVFLAIRLANAAAVASFAAFTEGVGQGSDLVLRAEAGALREADLIRLREVSDLAWIRPVVEGSFLRTPSQEAFELLGVDLVGLGDAAPPAPEPSAPQAPQAATAFFESLQDPAAVLIPQALAQGEHLKPGDPLTGLIDDRPVQLKVASIVPDLPRRPALQRHLLVMDLPAAQALLQRPGELDRVEFGCRPGRCVAELETALRPLLPPSAVLEAPEQRAESGRTMSAAFRFNLEVLSLIALAVGGYLLFQAFDAAVHRRRETWATLRALGVRPAQLRALVLLEAAMVGLLGSAAGVLLGWGLAQGAVKAVSRTVAALYGPSAASGAPLRAVEGFWALGLGFAACLLAAWTPARQAADAPPVQLLARGAGARPMRWASACAAGLLILALGLAVAFGLKRPPGVAWHAYLGAALILSGGSLASLGLLPLLGLAGRTEAWGRALALRPLCRPTGRHAWAAAALTVATGMAVGMGVMVSSFEGTVMAWTSAVLRADLFVAPLGSQGAASRHRLSESSIAALAVDPAVAAVDRFQSLPIDFRGRPTVLGSGELEVHGRLGHLVMAAGSDSAEVMAAIHRGGLADPGALASETFCRRFGVTLGARLELPTPEGPRTVIVRGIYADYGNERGSLILDRPVFLAWFKDPRSASAAVYLRPGEDAEAVAARWRAAHPGLQVRSNAGLRTQVATIFHQTFALTYALELIGLAVALAGLVEALLGLALERRGELLTLRALGARPREIAGVLLGEGLGVALAGLLGGLGVGWFLAHLLVSVLNPQVFGWTLAFHLPLPSLAALVALGLLAAAVALWPAALRAAKLPADREAEEGA
jgi:putative ABC transport system permease protein